MSPRAVVSTSALVELTGWSDDTIRRRANDGELEWRYADTDRPGRRSREYFVDSLPAEFQAKWSRQQLAAAAQSLASTSSGLALSAPTSPALTPESATPIRSRMIVTEEQQQQAEARLLAIQPLLDCIRSKAKPNFATPDGSVITGKDSLAIHIAAQSNVSRATVWNWVRRFQEFGIAGLADKPRGDIGSSRIFDRARDAAGNIVTLDKAKAFALAKCYRDRLSYRMTYERLKETWPQLDTNGAKLPSYSAVRSFLKHTRDIPEPVKIYGREGSTAYEAKCSPVLVRDFSVDVNEWWISDHVRHDCVGYNDCFPGLARYAAIRPWLTTFMDMRSRKVLGAAWNATPSSQTICTALRPGVLQYGPPKNAYIDNGVDYKHVGKIDDAAPALSGVLYRLGIRITNALPYSGQSKGEIESWHQTLHLRFDMRLGPFYCGNKPSNRPEECDDVLHQHKEFLAGKRRTTPLMPVSEIMRMAAQWIFSDYNENYRNHSGLGMNGRSPNEVFKPEMQPWVRPLENVALLDELFWRRESRKVIEGGCVQIFRERFEPADAASAAHLFQRISSEVVVAYNPLNIGEAIVIDPRTNEVIARMVAQKLIAQGPISRDQVQASMRTRRKLKKAVDQHLQLIGADFESEVDYLRGRAAAFAPAPEVFAEPKALPAAPAASHRGSLAVVTAPQFVEDVVDDILSDN